MPVSNPHTKIKSFPELQQEWQSIQALDLKSQMKALRTIGHEIMLSYQQQGAELAQLEFYIKVMRKVVKTSSVPEKASRFLSKLIIAWLQQTGNANVDIVLKKATKLLLVSGAIMIKDASYAECADTSLLPLLNQGKLFMFGTGTDGVVNVQLRVVDGPEPVLTAKEYKFVADSSEPAIIHIPSGGLLVADPASLGSQDNALSATISAGNYKVSVYFFAIPNKLQSFYIVLAKTDQEPINTLTRIYQFEV